MQYCKLLYVVFQISSVAERIDDPEAVGRFRVKPIVVLIMLLILLIATGSIRKTKRIIEVINREFINTNSSRERMESFKLLSIGLSNNIGSKPSSYKKHVKTVKVWSKVAEGSLINSSEDLKMGDLTVKSSSEFRDLDDTLMSYIKVKKSRISISECSRDLGIPPSEVKKTLVRLHEAGRIKLQWGIDVEPQNTIHHKHSF